MLYDLLKIIFLSLIPACFSYFLDYCFGFPQGEKLNTKAVFFGWTYFLSEKRAKKEGKLREIIMGFSELLNSDRQELRTQGVAQMKLTTVVAAREMFTYESIFGMCKFCTNFWLCLIAALIMFFNVHLIFFSNYFFFLFIPIFSHTILRKI